MNQIIVAAVLSVIPAQFSIPPIPPGIPTPMRETAYCAPERGYCIVNVLDHDRDQRVMAAAERLIATQELLIRALKEELAAAGPKRCGEIEVMPKARPGKST